MREVYLDNNATTPVDEEVLETMIETLRDNYGNPSSGHRRGARARKALEAAREKVAALLMATPAEILFCSGGTEANNAAILSAVQQAGKRRRLVTTPVEHPAVLNPMKKLADAGYDVREIPVLPSGELDLAAAEELITPETALVSVMAANNETGVLHPWAKVAQLGAAQGAFVHVDAVQAVAKVPIDLRRVPVDLLTISGHKLHSPKGIGALYVKKGRKLTPLLLGGHQEKGRRGGTENVPAAAALGKSCELLMVCDYTPVAALRDRLEQGLLAAIPSACVNGAEARRVPNTLSIGFEHVEGEAVVHQLSERGIFVSTGSACASGSLEPSHVLKAMAVPRSYAMGAVRFSLSLYTKARDIEVTLEAVPEVVDELRSMSPLWPPDGSGGEAAAWRS